MLRSFRSWTHRHPNVVKGDLITFKNLTFWKTLTNSQNWTKYQHSGNLCLVEYFFIVIMAQQDETQHLAVNVKPLENLFISLFNGTIFVWNMHWWNEQQNCVCWLHPWKDWLNFLRFIKHCYNEDIFHETQVSFHFVLNLYQSCEEGGQVMSSRVRVDTAWTFLANPGWIQTDRHF